MEDAKNTVFVCMKLVRVRAATQQIMIPKSAIEKAIRGGWNEEVQSWLKEADGDWNKLRSYQYQEMFGILEQYKIVLDPTFWQALGKALGWQETGKKVGKFYSDKFYNDTIVVAKAQRLTRLILTGGDTEKFWTDLLK